LSHGFSVCVMKSSATTYVCQKLQMHSLGGVAVL